MSGISSAMSSKVSLDALKNFLFLLRAVPSSLFTMYDRTSTFLGTIPFLHRPVRSCLLGCMRTISFFCSSESSFLLLLKYSDCSYFRCLSFSLTPFWVSGFRSCGDIVSKVLMRRLNILCAGDESITADGVFLHSKSVR